MISTGDQAPILISPTLAGGETRPYLDQYVANYHYGAKVAGLLILPPAWVPPFVALPAWMFDLWERSDGCLKLDACKRQGIDLDEVYRQVSNDMKFSIIARSSVVGESLEDHGRFKSVPIPRGASLDTLLAAINEVYSNFQATRGPQPGIGICVQQFIDEGIAGRVSNEMRLSNTRNQWKFEIERPYTPFQGINSIFVAPPAETERLRAKISTLRTTLRPLCHWVNDRVAERMHIEWVFAHGYLWVVQLDRENPMSTGRDPNTMPRMPESTAINRSPRSEIFSLYELGASVPWRKLLNVDDFWTDAEKPKHRLFFATGPSVQDCLANRAGRTRLANEIDFLTNGRSVLRTDCVDPSIPSYNLPRTHTVNGQEAVRWLKLAIAQMLEKGTTADQVAFILHRYIPARGAAWSFYNPGDTWVQIDCLWGLPDGLQFLSHDSYQIEVATGDELNASVRYKPNFLQEQRDGSWQYVRVARQFGRNRVLSTEALRTIAAQTVQIAQRVGDRAHIMWFCDLPPELGLGNHLPWYRSTEYRDLVERKRPPHLRSVSIRTLTDLQKIEESDEDRIALSIEPAVELIREDNEFLDRVVALAKARSLPVELAGSVLGHAYYKLVNADVVVLSDRPAHYRTRGRTVFGKVVRDAIPTNIAQKGERVRAARLSSEAAPIALVAKLIEEGLEVTDAVNENAKIEELGDVLEVLRGLASMLDVDWDDVEVTAKTKRETRGGFEKSAVLIETSRPKSNVSGANYDERRISLAELGSIVIEDNRVSVPFTRLVGKDNVSVMLSYRGGSVVLEIRFDEGALIVEVKSPPPRNIGESQLNLFPVN